MPLGRGKVVVLAGRLPATPKTRNGKRVMTGGQARCWPLTGCDTDPMHKAIIAKLSRPSERLCNAGAKNGVTWVD